MRWDDTEHAIARRLKLYEEQTEPLVSWYQEQGKLVAIDGIGPPDTVTDRLVRAIDRRWPAKEAAEQLGAMGSGR